MRVPLALLSLLVLLAAFLWVWFAGSAPASDQIASPGSAQLAQAQAPGVDSPLRTSESTSEQREVLPESAWIEQSAATQALDGAATFGMDVAVLDPDGGPIAGATVQVTSPAKQSAVTDELGLTRLALPTGTRRVELFVDADGFMHVRN